MPKKGIHMKKYILLFVTSLFLLSGCSNSQSNAGHPYEIVKDSSTLSYYDKEDDIDIDGFQVLDNSLQNFQDKNNNILVNDDGVIRCITITDPTVKTYQSISVGDSVDKIEDTFKYESKVNHFYSVLFDNNSEANPANNGLSDKGILINYYTDGSQITAIQICDVIYGREYR